MRTHVTSYHHIMPTLAILLITMLLGQPASPPEAPGAPAGQNGQGNRGNRNATPISERFDQLDRNKDGEITIDEFSEIVSTDRYILQPAFDLQKAIRQRMLGVKYWEQETQKRRVWFSGFDSTQHNSWESIQEILLIKQKERE